MVSVNVRRDSPAPIAMSLVRRAIMDSAAVRRANVSRDQSAGRTTVIVCVRRVGWAITVRMFVRRVSMGIIVWRRVRVRRRILCVMRRRDVSVGRDSRGTDVTFR